jgi:hypothetical protein
MIIAVMSPIDMGQSLAASGAQKVCPQLGAAEAEQAGICAAGTDFSLPKSVPEGQHRFAPPVAGFTTIGSNMDNRDHSHGAVLLCLPDLSMLGQESWRLLPRFDSYCLNAGNTRYRVSKDRPSVNAF